ncbi:MaoC family dehydratase [Cryobacterium melibiosiphilum]|uniref:MaoC family dehydratase n=1 Tax=Cryobacterium melibiosiphilum TaxID=995039 RepID=A0A3A5MJE1_9MICO|nr:MaoC family dehydratase [Cryobacterium melibiosiphilum]RJT89011.1 MaoC family dehydratase [Cryobacterium melibiosiphilum]
MADPATELAVAAGPHVFAGIAAVEAAVGQSLGVTPWFTVEQASVDAFASVTRDWQSLHCDPAVAALTPYGGTIAHGYLTVSLLSMFAGQLYRVEGVAHVLNYGIDRLRFPGVVPVGSRIRAHGTLTATTPKPGMVLVGVTYTVEVEGATRPGLVADTLVALVPHPAPPGITPHLTPELETEPEN